MGEPGRPRFYLCLPTFAFPGAALYRTPALPAVDPGLIVPLARQAETLGFDGVLVPDHLMTGRDEAVLEGWTTLAAIAGVTSRLRLGLIKQSIFFRPPALLAKMAATLDQLSGGRLIMFCGAGAYEDEHRAYGLDRPADPDARTAQLAEALELLRRLWSPPPQVPEGTAISNPHPMQQPLPVWLAGHDPASLSLAIEQAQGWNVPPVGLTEFRRRLDLLLAALAAANRPAKSIEVSIEIQVLIAPSHDDIRRTLRHIIALDPAATTGGRPPLLDDSAADYLEGRSDVVPPALSETWLIGTPDEVATQLDAYVAAGANSFLLWFVDLPDPAGMERFARRFLSSRSPT